MQIAIRGANLGGGTFRSTAKAGGKKGSTRTIIYRGGINAILYLPAHSYSGNVSQSRSAQPVSLYFQRSLVIDARRCVFKIAKMQRSALSDRGMIRRALHRNFGLILKL